MNLGFMKELPVTIPLLAFSRILHSTKNLSQTNKLHVWVSHYTCPAYEAMHLFHQPQGMSRTQEATAW